MMLSGGLRNKSSFEGVFLPLREQLLHSVDMDWGMLKSLIKISL